MSCCYIGSFWEGAVRFADWGSTRNASYGWWYSINGIGDIQHYVLIPYRLRGFHTMLRIDSIQHFVLIFCVKHKKTPPRRVKQQFEPWHARWCPHNAFTASNVCALPSDPEVSLRGKTQEACYPALDIRLRLISVARIHRFITYAAGFFANNKLRYTALLLFCDLNNRQDWYRPQNALRLV